MPEIRSAGSCEPRRRWERTVSNGSASLHFIIPPHTRSFGLGGALPRQAYLDRLVAYVRAAEAVGITGAFVYDFPVAMDPWLAAVDVLFVSPTLQPIV